MLGGPPVAPPPVAPITPPAASPPPPGPPPVVPGVPAAGPAPRQPQTASDPGNDGSQGSLTQSLVLMAKVIKDLGDSSESIAQKQGGSLQLQVVTLKLLLVMAQQQYGTNFGQLIQAVQQIDTDTVKKMVTQLGSLGKG